MLSLESTYTIKNATLIKILNSRIKIRDDSFTLARHFWQLRRSVYGLLTQTVSFNVALNRDYL
jgi:hypothetical protein